MKALKDSSVTDNGNTTPADANQGWNVTDNGNANCVVCGCGFFVKRAGYLLPETQASKCYRIIGSELKIVGCLN